MVSAEASQASKAPTHLSRLNLQEFQQRQGELDQERQEQSQVGADGGNKAGGLQVGVIQPSDSISKAGSTISKPVQQSN